MVTKEWRSVMLALVAVVAPAAFLFQPSSIPLANGQSVALHGSRGPPILFSSGLFGTMTHRIYADLFRKLRLNATVVTLQDLAPVTEDTVALAADALGVDRIGFLAHSSFDARVLASPRLQAAVLCDPVALPNLAPWPAGLDSLGSWDAWLTPARVGDCAAPVHIVRAQRSFEGGARTPIPEFLVPQPEAVVDRDEASALLLPPAPWTSEVVADVGHADLLDDRWADLGERVFPWIESGPAVAPRRFQEWRRRDAGTARDEGRRRARALYRARVARCVRDVILRP